MDAFWKLLALAALMLASFGMAPTATAATTPHHGAAEAMPMEHCPDPADTSDPADAVPECAMACSAALPAGEPAGPDQLKLARPPVPARLSQSLHGVDPDIVTPPPKLF